MIHTIHLAIPSPDLVIGLFASASQLLGLAAVAGSGYFVKRGRTTLEGTTRSRWVLGLTVLWLATVASFGLFYLKVEEQRIARLQRNLSRPSMVSGKLEVDSALRTLAYSDQELHPSGVTSSQLHALLARPQGVAVLDVREPEEVEVGCIAGSSAVRYPDLLADVRSGASLQPDSVLVCHSGNRSSELVERFAELDIKVRFLVGGLQKWKAEGRPLTGDQIGSNLRGLPRFENDQVLLDTRQFERALAEGEVLVIDTRQPEEFERDHLPGAINVMARNLKSVAVARLLGAAPAGRVIVAAYDKRSAFYGKLVALRLVRTGREFLGTYAEPRDYLTPPLALEHVTSWQEATRRATPYGALVALMTMLVRGLVGLLGSGWGVIVACLLARLATLPLSWKGSKDRWLGARLAPTLAGLHPGRGADLVRVRRAQAAARRAAGLTPLRNLLGDLLQLVLFLALLSAVGAAVSGGKEPFLWLADLSAPDGSGVLAVACGLLTAGLTLHARTRSTVFVALALLAGGTVAGLAWNLSAAQALYLVVALAWVGGQSVLSRRVVCGPSAPRGATILPLRRGSQRPGVGGKAARLAEMLRAGLPVPEGFVVPGEALACLNDGASSARVERAILRRFERLGVEQVAVRSSGAHEDGAEASQAGLFLTVLGVTGQELLPAVRRVAASLRLKAPEGSEQAGGVVVQAMVPAEQAGVLFTEHPAHAGQQLIEWTPGLGEGLVSGRVDPHAASYSRVSADLVEGTPPDMDLVGRLLQLGRELELKFGAPQDVEWAFAGGEVWLLQSRPVTVRAGDGEQPHDLFERGRATLLDACIGCEPDEIVYRQDGLTELCPEPTPFSAGLLRAMWEPGGTVDLACRSLGVAFLPEEQGPPRVQQALGRLWINVAVAQRQDRGLSARSALLFPGRTAGLETEVARLADRKNRQLPLDLALDPALLTDGALQDLYRARLDEFLRESYVTAERVNIAAQFQLDRLRSVLSAEGLDASEHMTMTDTPLSRGFAVLTEVACGLRPKTEFTDLMGHRAEHDFELSEPRYLESPDRVQELVARAPREGRGRSLALPSKDLPRRRVVDMARVQALQVLKEEAKHHALVDLMLLRRLVLELGKRSGLDEESVWMLEPEELADIGGWDAERVEALVAERTLEREVYEGMQLPTELAPRTIEQLERDGVVLQLRHGDQRVLQGARVSGEGAVEGPVRVCSGPGDLLEFLPGEVLVARHTDPSWALVFGRAAGLVTEVGGWLSHAAIQAREHRLPAIVGAPGAVTSLRTGDWVRLRQDGVVESIATPAVGSLRAMSLEARD